VILDGGGVESFRFEVRRINPMQVEFAITAEGSVFEGFDDGNV
jgi:hypothetical protein